MSLPSLLCYYTGEPTLWFFQLTAFKWPAQTDLSFLEHQWFTDVQPGPDLTDTPTLRGFTTPCWRRLQWKMCVKSMKPHSLGIQSVERFLKWWFKWRGTNESTGAAHNPSHGVDQVEMILNIIYVQILMYCVWFRNMINKRVQCRIICHFKLYYIFWFFSFRNVKK